MFKRAHFKELEERLSEPRNKIQVISGPRQVGKSTMVKQVLWGRWVESAVGTHLLTQADEYDYKLYYWRERDNEVDFIIDYNRQCIAIEVKSGRRTTNEGLGVFRDKFHPIQSFVVGSGGVPINEFLTWDIGRLLDDI